MTALLLAAAVEVAAVASPRVVAVSTTIVGSRQAIVVEAASDWGAVSVRRDGPEVVVTLAAEAADALAIPTPSAPIEGIQLEKVPGELRLRIRVPSDVLYEVRRDVRKLTLLFAARPPVGINPTNLDLYRSLFPAQPEPDMAPATGGEAPAGADNYAGFGLGPLRFQPSLVVSYIDADTTIQGPAPVRDRYYEIEPRLGAQLVLWDGHVRATYDPHFRFKSQVEDVNQASHDADVVVQLPIGPSLTVGGNGHYTLTTLQTSSADPGREYFFDLGRFSRTDVMGYAELSVGGAIKTRFEASQGRVRFREQAAFFSYDQQRLAARLEYSLGESTKMLLSWGHEHTPPPPARPIDDTTSDTFGLDLAGELPMLIQGKIGIAFKSESAPLLSGDAGSFHGIVASGSLAKEIGRNIRLSVGGGRNTYLSAFEDNAFYVSNSVNAAIDVRLPYAFFARAGASYRHNSYRIVVAGLGDARSDDLWGWTAGVGRTLTRWSYLRVDYGREERNSNIDSLDSHGRMLIVSLGLTPFGAR